MTERSEIDLLQLELNMTKNRIRQLEQQNEHLRRKLAYVAAYDDSQFKSKGGDNG
jgi:hypothetical protein